jgi:hypothetical protein
LIVEGPAEELLLPALAEACGRSFTTNGISVVNVGSVGLFRYARIFQSLTGTDVPLPVACVTDRDIVPDGTSYIQGRLDKEKAGVALPKGRKKHGNRKEADFTPDRPWLTSKRAWIEQRQGVNQGMAVRARLRGLVRLAQKPSVLPGRIVQAQKTRRGFAPGGFDESGALFSGSASLRSDGGLCVIQTLPDRRRGRRYFQSAHFDSAFVANA